MAKDVYDKFLTMQGADIKEVECTEDNNDNLRMMGYDLECELAAKSFFEYTQECGNLKRSGANHPKLALINEFLKTAGVIVSKYRSYVDNSSYLEKNKRRKGQKIAEIEQRFGTIGDPPYQPKKEEKLQDSKTERLVVKQMRDISPLTHK
ncbi:MAG: hypothetical protein VX737_06520 [Pseudomonadota bacterium]|nr:hypothetical protein [Pseudomonadota bacterium]